MPAMDGYFNVSPPVTLTPTCARAYEGGSQWNGGWPIHLTADSPRQEVECPKLDTDRHHIHHLGGRTFMAAVSPWFFTASSKLLPRPNPLPLLDDRS